MLVTLWKGLGYYMVIFLAGLQGIPKDLYEAAELDGSVGWRQHLDITLPLLRPYVALVAVISAIAATKVFEEVFLMTQGGQLTPPAPLSITSTTWPSRTRDQLRLYSWFGAVSGGAGAWLDSARAQDRKRQLDWRLI